MNHSLNPKTTTLTVRNSISPATAGRGFLLVALALAWFALFPGPNAFGVTPAPDGGYPNRNTAEGTDALKSTSTFSSDNTAIGFRALFANTDGVFNTATGSQALFNNTTGGGNTATGAVALAFNTTGSSNTATGVDALFSNIGGDYNTATGVQALENNDGTANTATGFQALFANTTGGANTATGFLALQNNTTGNSNTATGVDALVFNTTGNSNTATGTGALRGALFINNTGNNNTAEGADALFNNTSGNNNTAEGFQALANNSTGSNNIALGANAGLRLTTGSNNIDIGALGVAGESNTIRIGVIGLQKSAYMQGISGETVASGVTVIVGSNGHLGTVQSSARFKDEIKPMDKASEVILALKPVTFHYKKELDPEGIPQFGLVAEQVEKVDPDLVARDENGRVYTVRYEAVNAMLLNEFLKEHRVVREQEATIAQLKSNSAKQEATIIELKSTVAQQEKQMKVFAANLKEQATQIQKASALLELTEPTPQVALNNQ